jgi:hypothetical protein
MAGEQAATYFTPQEDLYADDELEEDMPEYVESELAN